MIERLPFIPYPPIEKRRLADAEDVLTQAERIAGDLLLFAEEIDPRTGSFLGNTPLLFSQMEYVRAIVALSKAREQRPS